MRLVTRYILREHIGPLAFSVTTLTSLLLLNYISKRFSELVGKGLPWQVIGKFFLLSVPFTLAMTLPMAVLISTLYAFSRLTADSEVTAMMSCGVGTRQLMAPGLAVGLVLSLLMVGFNDQVLPRTNEELSSLTTSISQKKPTLALKPEILNEVSKQGLYMWVNTLDTKANAMTGVTIYDVTDPQARHTIVADSGTLAFAPNQSDLLLTLFTGYVQVTRLATPERYERTFFRTNVMRVADVANQLIIDKESGYKGDREMTVCELQHEVERAQASRDSTLHSLATVDPAVAAAFSPHRASRAGKWYCAAVAAVFLPPAAGAQARGAVAVPQGHPVPRGASAAQIAQTPRSIRSEAMVKSLGYAEKRMANYEVEIQKKFALSLACLVFALLGPPIALMFPRSGIGLTIGVSLAVFSVYYVGLIGGETLGNNLKVSPVIAMWAANAIMTTIGLVLVSRMGRRGANARGGALQGVFDRISQLFRKRARA